MSGTRSRCNLARMPEVRVITELHIVGGRPVCQDAPSVIKAGDVAQSAAPRLLLQQRKYDGQGKIERRRMAAGETPQAVITTALREARSTPTCSRLYDFYLSSSIAGGIGTVLSLNLSA